MNKSLLLAAALASFAALAAAPAVAAEQPPFERVDGMILPAGEWALRSAAIEPSGRYAYFGTMSYSDEARVVLINLQTFERVTSRHIPGIQGFVSAVMDPSGTYAYFGSWNGTVVRIQRRRNINGTTSLSATTLSTGVGLFQMGAAVMDPSGDFAYFGTGQEPARVIKVNLSDFTTYEVLTLNAGDKKIRAAAIDPAGVFGYFGINTNPGRVVKVHLPTMQRVAMVEVGTFVSAMEMEPGGSRVYAAYPLGGMTTIDLATFTAGGNVLGGQTGAVSSVIDSEGRYLYLGTGGNRILRIDLDTFQLVNEITLPTGERRFTSAVMSPDGMFAYFGTDRALESGGTQPGQVIKVRVGEPGNLVFWDNFED